MVQATLTPAQFEAKRAALKAQYGIDLQGNEGEATHTGVTVKYQYACNVLTLQVVKKPMLLPASAVDGQMKKWLNG